MERVRSYPHQIMHTLSWYTGGCAFLFSCVEKYVEIVENVDR